MGISIAAETVFDKSQYTFMIKKNLHKLDMKGTLLKIIKAICDKPTSNITLNDEKLQNISSQMQNKLRASTRRSSPTQRENQGGKGDKGHHNWNKGSQVSHVCRQHGVVQKNLNTSPKTCGD